MPRRTAAACVAALSLLTAAVAAAPAHAAPAVHRRAPSPVRNEVRLRQELGLRTPLGAHALAHAAAASRRPAVQGALVTPLAVGQTGTAGSIPRTVVEQTPLVATFYIGSPTLHLPDGTDAPPPTGTVTYYEVDENQQQVGAALGSVALTPDLNSTAVAEATTPQVALPALHDIVATYSGDGVYAPIQPTSVTDAVPAYAKVVTATPGPAQDLQRLYLDVLGRNPDTDGFAYWLGALQQGHYKDAAFSFALSDERLSDEIASSYELVLGRPVDTGGAAYYLGLFHQGLTVPGLQVLLSLSPEFSGVAVDNGYYVAALYYVFLGRQPDDGGYAYYTGLLDKGLESRAQMAGEFSYSDEHDTLVLTGLYAGFLDRAPDSGGVAYWIDALRHGYRQELIAYSMSTSPEYRNLLTPTP